MAPLSIEVPMVVEADSGEGLQISFPMERRKLTVQSCGASGWALSRSRRTMDFALATLALMACFPLMLVVAAAVRMGSRGPVLFRQMRMGRHGKEFVLLKFRSMYSSEVSGPCVTVDGDPRITRVGAFLRRFKLDELPQFWNVVKGDLSLVGPRPKLAHLEPLHMSYRPGITGSATLVFRCEESLLADVPESGLDAFYHAYIKPKKAQMDEEYMENATLLSDLQILFQTATSWTREPHHPVLDQIAWEASLNCRESEEVRQATHRKSGESAIGPNAGA